MKINNAGQALFEFLAFTPLLLGLISLMISISASLNGGINQQKAARGYFYNILKGNSNIESSSDLRFLINIGATRVGFFAIGYQEKDQGQIPIATCYRLHMFGPKDSETCEDADTNDGDTEFVRVLNLYGVCGATYLRNPVNGGLRNEFHDASCVIKTD